MMTPKERAAAALTCKIPDQIPTFELEFQLTQEYIGGNYQKAARKRGIYARTF
jgi:hypothetical protein